MQLECVVLNRTSPASQLVVEWFVWKPNHPEREAVARLSREATFHYGEQAAKNNLKGRLHLESPSPGVFRLFLQNAAVQDSGTYSCHVEEWLPSPRGLWYKRAEDTAGQTAVTVTRPGEGSCPWASTPVPTPPVCMISHALPNISSSVDPLSAVTSVRIHHLHLRSVLPPFPPREWQCAHLASASGDSVCSLDYHLMINDSRTWNVFLLKNTFRLGQVVDVQES